METKGRTTACLPLLAKVQLILAVSTVGCGRDLEVRPQPPETVAPSPVARGGSSSFDERIRAVYDFKPSKVSDKDRDSKSNEMDALWATVDKEPATYLPKLREELKRKGQNRFFLFDGSQLLLKNSQAPEDLVLAATSMGQTELEDVQPAEYFYSVHRLAVQGVNVWPCVNNILSDPEFKVFIPEHALTLGQGGVVVYCLLPMREELYVSALRARLKSEEDPGAVKSILAGLSMAVTPDAQLALLDFSRQSPNREFRGLAKPLARLPLKKDFAPGGDAHRELLFTFLDDLIHRHYDNPAYDFKKFKKMAPSVVKKDDLSKIRDLRRKHSARVSDEAIDEIEYLTLLMKVSLGCEE